jgi:hypothetical protein
MDVAALVGFSASGPLDTPVVVEDFKQFTNVFGGDLRLAWDPERGDWIRAHLPSAVRAFFENGGRRCWVVRVAGARAAANRFSLPGLLALEKGTVRPAVSVARAVGSWSDALRVGCALSSRTVSVQETSPPGNEYLADVSRGDLVRVNSRNSGMGFLAPVLEPGRIQTHQAIWFTASKPEISLPATARIHVGSEAQRELRVTTIVESTTGISLRLAATLAEGPATGSFLCVSFAAATLWLVAKEVRSEDGGALVVEGNGAWLLNSPPTALPAGDLFAEVLEFEIWAQESDQTPHPMTGQGFLNAHPKFWGDLATDNKWFSRREALTEKRFPLAAEEDMTADFFFPAGMDVVPEVFASPFSDGRAALERDGLDQLRPDLFLDPRLQFTSSIDLDTEARFLRFQRSSDGSLKGIHSLLDLEEHTILAVPDLVQPGWERAGAFVTSPPPIAAPAVSHRAGPLFKGCEDSEAAPPVLSATEPNAQETFLLSWVAPGAANFRVEESNSAQFDQAVDIYSGPHTSITLSRPDPGRYFYRTRTGGGLPDGDWSNVVEVRISPAVRYQALSPSRYSKANLLAVHRCLLRFCAARGDVIAVLALPEHYREADAITHVEELRGADLQHSLNVPAIGSGEESILSFGALYHPWLTGRDFESKGALRATPPDGPACGILARRAILHGAWSSPANEFLRGGFVTLRLSPLPDRFLELQEAHVNLVRQEPGGFVCLSQQTLSDDPDLLRINVRRLLMLLRRLAVREGTLYVFEPNDGGLRRLVRRSFEGFLNQMFQRGAFAGATPALSYQVGVSAEPEEGRLTIELRVAPSVPMKFLTVRLIQVGDRMLVREVR